MKDLSLLSLPELGELQSRLEFEQTRNATLERHEEMWQVELEIRQREEQIEKELDDAAMARMVARAEKFGDDFYPYNL